MKVYIIVENVALESDVIHSVFRDGEVAKAKLKKLNEDKSDLSEFYLVERDLVE